MINENAPGVLLLSIDNVLDNKDQQKLYELKSKTSLKKEEEKEKTDLEVRYQQESELLTWIPIPVNTQVIPFASSNYHAEANRTVDMLNSKPYLTNLQNTQDITFVSDANVFANALIFTLDYMFQLDTARPSLQYYSDELVFGKSYLASYMHNFDIATSKHTIKITIQKSIDDSVGKFLKKTKVLKIK